MHARVDAAIDQLELELELDRRWLDRARASISIHPQPSRPIGLFDRS